VAVLGVVLVAVAAAVGIGSRQHDTADTVAGGGQQTVAVRLVGMRIEPSTITVQPRTRLTLAVTNADQISHDLYVEGAGQTPLLAHGQSARLDVGTITHPLAGWCTVPGHKAAGMTLSIKIASSTPSTPATDTMPGMEMGGDAAAIDWGGSPAPDWKPADPTLTPAASGTVHQVTFTIRDATLEVAPGVRQTLWTYNGTAPGPILHGRVGDRFVVTIVNDGDMAHSIDFHAGSVSPDAAMRSIDPGQSLTYAFTATYAGAWLYHCSTMPMSLHIANGMFGAVIVDPPNLPHVDKELVLVQSELYLGAQDGIADETKIRARAPDAFAFNGYVNQYKYAPIEIGSGARVRIWVVDAGPQFGTSFHVVGAQFDTVFKEGAYLLRPHNAEHGAAQTLDLAPGQGGFVEFTLTAPGHYSFVDHAMVDAEAGASGTLLVK